MEILVAARPNEFLRYLLQRKIMGTRPLEEAYLVGMFLSQVAWGRMAGVPSTQLRRPAGSAKDFLNILGSPHDLAKDLDPMVESASGKPRTLKGSDVLREVTEFRSKVLDPVIPNLSPKRAAAMRVGFLLPLALALAQLGVESPNPPKPSLIEVLSELSDAARPLQVFQVGIDLLRVFAEAAQVREDYMNLHSHILAQVKHTQAELRQLSDE